MGVIEYEVTVTRLDSGQADRRTFAYRGLEPPLVGATITVTRAPTAAYSSRLEDELRARVDRIERTRIYASEVRPAQGHNG